jgi:hypothetical protein
MNRDEIKPGVFCRHYKDMNKIYQIVGIAKTDDVNSVEEYNKKPCFYAYDTEDNGEIYMGFIFPNQEIVISLNRRDCIINDKYVIYNRLTESSLESSAYYNRRIFARKLDNFCGIVEHESGILVSRFLAV